MTNAEKYLKDGVDEEQFVNDLHYFWWANEYDVCDGIRKFLQAEVKKVKPTLTEDERVILRNLNKEIYTTIGCDRNGLYLHNDSVACCREYAFYDMFGDLFQFIKERRRILH